MTPGRIAIGLLAGIFISVWFASSILRWMPSLQYAFCGLPRGPMCTVGTLMFGYAYYAALTVPLTTLVLAFATTRMLGRPAHDGADRPLGVVLGALLLAAGALFQLIGFGLELGVRLQSGQWNMTAVVNAAMAPLLALAAIAAAWLLWKMRESGRRLALLVLAVTIVSSLWTIANYPAGIRQSPVPMAVLALRMVLFGYLLVPRVRARFAPRA